MNNQNQGQKLTSSENNAEDTYLGQRWLVEERDACGVGFITHRRNQANHEILRKALTALTCLEHRGGCSADQDSGDGAGILTAIPWKLFQSESIGEGINFLSASNIAVGMIFLPPDIQQAQKAKAVVEECRQIRKINCTRLASSSGTAKCIGNTSEGKSTPN